MFWPAFAAGLPSTSNSRWEDQLRCRRDTPHHPCGGYSWRTRSGRAPNRLCQRSHLDWRRPLGEVARRDVCQVLCRPWRDQEVFSPVVDAWTFWGATWAGQRRLQGLPWFTSWGTDCLNWRPHIRAAEISGQPKNRLQVWNLKESFIFCWARGWHLWKKVGLVWF